MSPTQRQVLGLLAGDRPLYPCSDGPHVLRPDGSWLRVAPATVRALAHHGWIERGETFWTITEAGRAAIRTEESTYG